MKNLIIRILPLFVLAMVLLLFSCDPTDPKAPEDYYTTIYNSSKVTNDCSGKKKDYNLIEVTDRGEGTGTMTWTSDKTYVLNGRVFVNEGQTLTIEAGTIIKGAGGSGESASALIVARGGKLIAEGTVDKPIIFTSKADEIARDVSGTLSCKGGNLSPDFRGLWGGLILLGKATINSSESELAIEGIPTSEKRGLYGGTDDSDNSGSLKYISIRYGGASIGADNEINGLTLGGVGNGTKIEYIEVIANKDDGVEFFGGSVNTKHIVISNCGDDSFDADEGYHGNNQFWVTFQDDAGDNGGEHDGGPKDCLLCTPLADFTVFNATYIGNGKNRAIRVRENCAATYKNSIFINYAKGYEIKDEETLAQFKAHKLVFANNVMWNIDKPWERKSADVEAELLAAGNTIDIDPGMNDKYIPSNDLGEIGSHTNEFIQSTTYKGAFDPSSNTRWIDGWSLISTIK